MSETRRYVATGAASGIGAAVTELLASFSSGA
jgi:NAD(P)-dependent dehydrogenase (short-subunit alcohol dehydrogenase family)